MVKLIDYDEFALLSVCCNKIMQCSEDDIIDWNARLVKLKGRCPFCKTRFQDFPNEQFFYAHIIDL